MQRLKLWDQEASKAIFLARPLFLGYIGGCHIALCLCDIFGKWRDGEKEREALLTVFLRILSRDLFLIYRDCFLIVLVSKYSPTVGYKRASLQPCAVSNPCIIGQHISYLWAPSFLSQLQPHMACCCLLYILETSMSGLAWYFFPIWTKFPLDAYLVHFPPWSTCTYLTLQWCFNNH